MRVNLAAVLMLMFPFGAFGSSSNGRTVPTGPQLPLIQWTANGVAVSTSVGHQINTTIVSDGAGGAIVAWRDDRRGPGAADIYAQRINAIGIPAWGIDGIALLADAGQSGTMNNLAGPTIVPDGTGGAIIAWEDDRNGNYDVYAQKIGATGQVQWSINGVALCTAAGWQAVTGFHEIYIPTIVSDGAGGAIVTWVDERRGLSDIYAQRIDALGVVRWTANGVALSTRLSYTPAIVSDGAGGAIVTWVNAVAGTPRDVYAQRIDASGAVQWAVDGIAICTAAGYRDSPAIATDTGGGAIVTWYDRRGGGADIYAQRVDSVGATRWTTNGVNLCAAAGDQWFPLIAPDQAGGAIVVWWDKRSGDDVFAQRIDAAGVVVWAPNGVLLSTAPGNQVAPSVVADGSGGAVVAWSDNSRDLYVQQIDMQGVAQWTAGGVLVCDGFHARSSVGSDGAGGAIVAWQDVRANDYDVYAQRVGIRNCPSLAGVVPISAGTCGFVTLQAYGCGLVESGNLQLRSNGAVVSPTSTSVSADSRIASASFDLRGASPGTYDVVYVDPLGEEVDLVGAFEVEGDCIEPDLWVELAGRNVARINRQNSYYIMCGNRGNVDAYGAYIWLTGIPSSAEVSVVTSLASVSGAGIVPAELDTVAVFLSTDVDQRAVFFLPVIPANSTRMIHVRTTVGALMEYDLEARIYGPLFTLEELEELQAFRVGSPQISDAGFDCITGTAELVLDVLTGLVPAAKLSECARSIGELFVGRTIDLIDMHRHLGQPDAAYSAFGLTAGLIHFSLTSGCLEAIPYVGQVLAVVTPIFEAASLMAVCYKFLREKDTSELQVTTVGSSDPNEKVGPSGVGVQRFIRETKSANYKIYFENLPAATASAQRVEVTDQLDVARLNLATLRVGPGGFGSHLFVPFWNGEGYSAETDLRPENNLIVRATVDVQPDGLVRWVLQAIDPDTGLPPDDPLAGFLPPNVESPEGEGWLSFTIDPVVGLGTGVTIDNAASIVFDENPAIQTNVWGNMLDLEAPASAVDPLNPVIHHTEFDVAWSGFDPTSGLQDVTIFVSDNGSEPSPWLAYSIGTTATFVGEFGHTYSFYSVARDNVGNVEDAPAVPDATIVLEETLVTLFGSVRANLHQDGTRLVWEVLHSDDLVGFNVYRSRDGITYDRLTDELLPANAREYADARLAPGSYTYRIGAVDQDGEFTSASFAVVVPTRPLAFHPSRPNPSTGPIDLSFYLPTDGQVALTIYDVAGRRVRTVTDGRRAFGSHLVSWDGKGTSGRDVPSGIYFGRLTFEGRSMSQKLVITR